MAAYFGRLGTERRFWLLKPRPRCRGTVIDFGDEFLALAAAETVVFSVGRGMCSPATTGSISRGTSIAKLPGSPLPQPVVLRFLPRGASDYCAGRGVRSNGNTSHNASRARSCAPTALSMSGGGSAGIAGNLALGSLRVDYGRPGEECSMGEMMGMRKPSLEQLRQLNAVHWLGMCSHILF
jgi:hypothetical protein